MSTDQVIKLIFVAFALGLAVPLAVQLFLTLRTTQRTISATRARVERTLDTVDGLVAKFQAQSPGTQALSALGAALIPAASAAFKAWRESSAPSQGNSLATVEKTDGQPQSEHNVITENENART